MRSFRKELRITVVVLSKLLSLYVLLSSVAIFQRSRVDGWLRDHTQLLRTRDSTRLSVSYTVPGIYVRTVV